MVFEGPFLAVRIPPLRLKAPQIERPPRMLVFALVYLSYFLVLSGIIYDIIIEPPSMGQQQDPVTGQVKPVTFMAYRINGQYIIEGLASGFLYSLGGLGLIMLDMSNDKGVSRKLRYIYLAAGVAFAAASYSLITLFLRIKMPNYMQV